MKTKRLLLTVLATSMLIAPCLFAGDDKEKNRGQFSNSDYKFVCAAAHGGLFEVEAGNLAAIKATDPRLKEFGQRMAADHGQAGTELKALAAKKGATVPAQLSEEQSKKLEKLRNLSGKEFNEAYTDVMITTHKKNLNEYEKQAKSADDAELKAFASAKAMTVAHHLQTIKDISKKQS